MAGDRRVNIDRDGIGGDRVGRGRDIGDAVRQAARGRQGIGVVAVGVVGDAAAGIAVPRAGADIAGGRDIDQLIVCGAVAERVAAKRGRGALAGRGGGRLNRGGLAVSQRNPRDLRLQGDIGHIGDLRAVAEAVAVVPCRVAGTTGDRNPGRKGQAKQTNKGQEPPHESSPLRAVEPRNGR